MERAVTRNAGHHIKLYPWLVAILLLLFIFATGIVLFLRIGAFTYAKEADKVIELLTADNSNKASADKSNNSSDRKISDKVNPGFQASDDNVVWEKNTDIEIFSVSYKDGEGTVTVSGENGEKVVAPGTENEYTCNIANTGNVALDYKMEATAVFSDDFKTYEVPVKIKLIDNNKRYLVGSNDAWAEMSELNKVSEKGTLGADSYKAYTLNWQWPYESGQDAFDTMLGDLSVDRELSMTVKLNVRAEYNEEPGARGGTPRTGDDTKIMFWFIVAILSLAAIVFILLLKRRKTED